MNKTLVRVKSRAYPKINAKEKDNGDVFDRLSQTFQHVCRVEFREEKMNEKSQVILTCGLASTATLYLPYDRASRLLSRCTACRNVRS